MRKTSGKKLKSNKFSSSKFLYIFVFFGILLTIFLIMQFHFFDSWFNQQEELNINIPDNCGLILGNLMHEISGEADCVIRCQNQCGLKEMNYFNSTFVEGTSSCHSCNCICE